MPVSANHFWGDVICYNTIGQTCEASTTSVGDYPIPYEWYMLPPNTGFWDDPETDVNYNIYICSYGYFGRTHNLYTSVIGYPENDAHGCFYCPI